MSAHQAGTMTGLRDRFRAVPENASRRKVLLDLGAFAGTVVLAVTMRWETRDLVWALWISSLVVGYATIATTIVRGVRKYWHAFSAVAIFGGAGLLAFFTFHFGMFHFVHSVFLDMFFPLYGDPEGFPNFARTAMVALAGYWPFVLASLVSRLEDLDRGGDGAPDGTVPGRGAAMSLSAPYRNVVRMHILIFVFAGLHAAGLSRFALYPVLAAYFFPWETLRRP
ncbi:MAG: hypothetical protein GF405_11145 [Candidatus Eisenbacteria bacterium]|nr:hypothetical protein [Candidatus Eisenbacteria bacterium]